MQQESEPASTDLTAKATRDKPLLPVDPWALLALSGGNAEAEAQVRRQAHEIARALAAYAIAMARDARADEYEERIKTLDKTMWPKERLAGYTLASSLGAFLLARSSMTWAPPTDPDPREEPFDRDGLLEELRRFGVDGFLADALVGEWSGVDRDFSPKAEGLDASLLAGLCEQTLTKRERTLALSELAFSPRALARLSASAPALAGVRRLLPTLPSDDVDFSPTFVTAMSALILDRPERTLELAGAARNDPVLSTLREIASVQRALKHADDPPELPEDETLREPEYDREARPRDPSVASEAVLEQDVLEIVEERISAPIDFRPERLPQPPAWLSAPEGGMLVQTAAIQEWYEERMLHRSPFAELGHILGLAPVSLPSWVPGIALPPFPPMLEDVLTAPHGPADEETQKHVHPIWLPIFPVARVLLRVALKARRGTAPSANSVQNAGDLAWFLRRARAIALIVGGDLEDAMVEVAPLGGLLSPEGRFAHVRHLRFQGRAAEPAKPAEVSQLVSGLIHELSCQLGRTIAGTLL